VKVCSTSGTATGSARDRQYRHSAKGKKERPFTGPPFSQPASLPLRRTLRLVSSRCTQLETNGPLQGPRFHRQPASRYAERSARYPAGAPGLKQDGPSQGPSFHRPVTKVYMVVAVNIDIPQHHRKHATFKCIFHHLNSIL
jgi:hypothetical protein